MAQPTQKAPALDKFFQQAFGINRRESIQANVCVFCGQPALVFRDELCRKEFSISGICQPCQDGTFGGDEDD